MHPNLSRSALKELTESTSCNHGIWQTIPLYLTNVYCLRQLWSRDIFPRQSRGATTFSKLGASNSWSRLLYSFPVSCTAVCYVTVIALFIKKVGVVRPNFGGSGPPPDPQWLRPWDRDILTDSGVETRWYEVFETETVSRYSYQNILQP